MVQNPRVNLCLFAVLIFAIWCALSFVTVNPCRAEEKPRRPRVGLVLGGGGAKGSAHIGVLRVLEEMKVPVDYVAGTSMGAVVGSLYASGMSSEEIERALTTVDWDDLFKDSPPRSEIDFRRKQEDFLNLSAIELGIKDGKVRTPRAFIAGQKIGLLFEILLMPVSDIENFDELPTPYRAVAADLEKGEMVVLSRGRLADAARASMSVPGVFPPLEVNGRLLCDGGIVRNLPVDIVREMGADIVIAVDVGQPLPPQEELGSPMAIMNQMVDIMIKENVNAQIDRLRAKDIFIHPDLGTITAGDFKRGKEAIERGMKAARQKEAELGRLSVVEQEYAPYRRRHERKQPASYHIESVRIEGLSRVSPDTVLSKMGIKQGQVIDRDVDADQIKRGVGLIYGMGDFERVDLHARRKGDVYDLTLHLLEKPWGPNYLRWGISLESSLKGTDFNILVDYTMRWLNRLGAEWKNQVEIGSDKLLFSEFYQPLERSRTLFVAPRAEWRQQDVDLYRENDVVAEYRVRYADAGIDFGIQPWSYGEVRLGYVAGRVKPKLLKGTLNLPTDTIDTGAFRARVIADQFDNVNFPHSGHLGVINYYASLPGWGADDRYDKIDIGFSKAFSYHEYAGSLTARYGSYIGENLPFYDLFTLGGFLNLSGYQKEQLRGQQVGFGRLMLYWKASQSLLGNFYLGVSAEAGNVWQSGEHPAVNELLWGGSVFVGYDTPLGPLYVGVGDAEGGITTVYLFLGRVY